jgi:hypothetical protein
MPRGVLLIGLSLAAVSGPARAQSSPRFALERLTIAGTTTEANSARFTMRATLAQEVPVGTAAACNNGYAHSNGFWSVMGDVPAQIVLRANRSATHPSEVDLSWTGSDPSFGIHRSDTPGGVSLPANLIRTTSSCAASDAPPAASVVYYLVVPAGP